MAFSPFARGVAGSSACVARAARGGGRLILLAAFATLMGSAPSPPSDPFRVNGRPPTMIHATRDPEPFDPDFATSPMLARLAGHAGRLDPAALVLLRRALGRIIEPPTSPAETTVVIHLYRADQTQRIEILALGDGRTAAIARDDPQIPPREIRASAVAALPIRPPMPPPLDAAPAARLRLTGDRCVPASVTLDPPTRRRLFGAHYPDLTRDLPSETIHIRLPRNWSPDRPSGVLLWISPTEDARVPTLLEPALDELNLIAVSADRAHNERPITDRLQLCLDAVQTARSRFIIDESRIYASGLSGGARCAAILQCCMPDLFTGAVPIAGLDSYHDAPTGSGALAWPARFAKPAPRTFALLKSRRIRVITGDQDFNEPEILARSAELSSDGIDITTEVVPGMGHTMPTPERFAEALRWVDQPASVAAEQGRSDAKRLLQSIGPDHPDPAPSLIEVTRLAPWSQTAWQAAERLGFSPP